MQETTTKRDWSLPFATLLLISLIFLSGCNLNQASDQALEVMEKDEPVVMEEKAPEGTVEIVQREEVPKAQYAAGKVNTYSKEAFDKALADNKTILLDFHADWCKTCVGNAPKVKEAVESNGDVVGFKVNYDTAKELKKQFSVNSQSTFIVLKGGEESGRTMGPQSVESLSELIGA